METNTYFQDELTPELLQQAKDAGCPESCPACVSDLSYLELPTSGKARAGYSCGSRFFGSKQETVDFTRCDLVIAHRRIDELQELLLAALCNGLSRSALQRGLDCVADPGNLTGRCELERLFLRLLAQDPALLSIVENAYPKQ